MVGHRFIAIFFTFGLFQLSSYCQQAIINEPPAISRMLEAFAEKNKSQEKVKAWTIQVLARSDRRAVENEKVRFEKLYPYLKVEWIHDDPYYILKIRDVFFKEKMDALHLLHRIKRRYPSAILVLDDVRPEKLLNSTEF